MMVKLHSDVCKPEVLYLLLPIRCLIVFLSLGFFQECDLGRIFS